jgi:RNA recognition motif-containing protein
VDVQVIITHSFCVVVIGFEPNRTVFLVRKKGQDRHLGYGFVTYALLDDAKRAVERMNGKPICGRAVQVGFANRRAPLHERRVRGQEVPLETEEKADQEKQTPEKPAPKAAEPRLKPAAASSLLPAGSDKHRFVRTLALGGLTEGNRKDAIKKAKKAGKVISV